MPVIFIVFLYNPIIGNALIFRRRLPDSSQLLLDFKNGRLVMTFDRIVSVVACVATVICAVITLLSYFDKKK